MNDHRPARSGRYRHKKNRQWQLSPLHKQLFLGALVFILILALVSVIWYVTRIESWQIEQLEVSGGSTISHEVVEDKVWSVLQGSYLRLVPKTFAIFYPKNELVRSIKEMQRIKEVRVSRHGLNRLSVYYEEYVPKALWCEYENRQECLFLDETGFAFSKAPTLTGATLFRFVTTGQEVSLDTIIVEESLFLNALSFANRLASNFDYRIASIVIDGEEDVEFELVAGGSILISRSVGFDVSFENLRTVLASESFQELPAGEFRYIDLRFGDRIFINDTLLVEEEEVIKEEEEEIETRLDEIVSDDLSDEGEEGIVVNESESLGAGVVDEDLTNDTE